MKINKLNKLQQYVILYLDFFFVVAEIQKFSCI